MIDTELKATGSNYKEVQKNIIYFMNKNIY